MLEDSLRAIGVIEDDDPKHVARTVIEVVGTGHRAGETKEDYVLITINSFT
jgi:hypothetical protein